MSDNILKGSIVLIMLAMLVVCLSAVSAESNADDALEVLTISQDGISFDYPSDWQSSRSTSNYSIMSISKIDSVDSLGIAKVSINVEKKPLEGDFNTFVNNTYQTLSKTSSYELISSGAISVNHHESLQFSYTSLDDTGNQKEHKAVWFEKNGQAYVLLYSAPLDQFENNLYVFDYILSEIKIS